MESGEARKALETYVYRVTGMTPADRSRQKVADRIQRWGESWSEVAKAFRDISQTLEDVFGDKEVGNEGA